MTVITLIEPQIGKKSNVECEKDDKSIWVPDPLMNSEVIFYFIGKCLTFCAITLYHPINRK